MRRPSTADRLFWPVFLLVLVCISFCLMVRDARQKFGAVSFGAFPHFWASNAQGVPFSPRRLKGEVSAVQFCLHADGCPEVYTQYLAKLSQRTSRAKRSLRIIHFRDDANIRKFPMGAYRQDWAINPSQASVLAGILGELSPEKIFLVDHNGIIRGAYNLSETQERLRLEANLRALL